MPPPPTKAPLEEQRATAGRRAAVIGALVIAAVALAAIVWRAKAGDAPPPAGSSSARNPKAHEAPAGGTVVGQPGRPAPSPAATPALPASAYEPTIDLPAPPPPEEGAGDDFVESGLPRSLFDGKIALERLSPSPPRLETAEARLGHKIAGEARAQLLASFQRHDEAAATAIGDFRLRAISEEKAAAIIARERAAYRKEAAAALGVTDDQLERLFADTTTPSR